MWFPTLCTVIYNHELKYGPNLGFIMAPTVQLFLSTVVLSGLFKALKRDP